MPGIFQRHSLFITAFILIVVCLKLMSASIENSALPRFGGEIVHSVVSPIQGAHESSVSSTQDLWRHYVWLTEVSKERDSLAERIKVLEAQNSRLLEFDQENQRLSVLLDFKRNLGVEGIAARVTGRDPSNWVRTVTVDQGEEKGLKVNMPVVDGEAIVGQVTLVNDSASKVLLLTDNSSAVDAIVQRNRAAGIIQGTGQDQLLLKYISKETSVLPGDRVIASGLGGVYPKGTLIGVVSEVSTPRGGFFHDITVKPSVDFSRLENVLVVTSQKKHVAKKKSKKRRGRKKG